MNRHLLPIALLTASLIPMALSAQTPPPSGDPAAAKKAAIDKLSFLVGEWEGEGSMQRGPAPPERFKSWERVETRLGGQLLVIDGRHTSLKEGELGKVVHEAFAMLTWDEANQRYSFRSQVATGRGGDFEGKVEDGAFVWLLPTPQGTIRYTVRLDGQGRWHEIGEISNDGKAWRQFFEMTLSKRSGGKA